MGQFFRHTVPYTGQKWEYLFATFKFEPRGSISDKRNYDWKLDRINNQEAPRELRGRFRYEVFRELGMDGWELMQFTRDFESSDTIAIFKRPISN